MSSSGPYGGDKVNILKAGGDYGWPDYGYGRNNDSSPMGIPTAPGIEPALLVWMPGITPSGLLFYTGDKFPAWKGNLMVGSIVRGRTNGASGVERVVFNDKMWETRRETFLRGAQAADSRRPPGSGRPDLPADRRGRRRGAEARAGRLR